MYSRVVCVYNTSVHMCGATLFVRVCICACIEARETEATAGRHMAHMSSRSTGTLCRLEPVGEHAQSLLPPLSGCDCFVTKDDSQRDGFTRVCAAPIVYAKLMLESDAHTYVHTQIYSIHTVRSAKLCQVITECKAL